jgi:hypothetical protein
VYLTLPAQNVGPLNKNAVKVGTGHYRLERTPDLSIPGEWTVTLQLRVQDFEQKNLDYHDTVT